MKRPTVEMHCICGAYRIVLRNTLGEAERVIQEWYAEHCAEDPELDHAIVDKDAPVQVHRLSAENLLDLFEDEAFECGAETDLQRELRAEILRRVGKGAGKMVTIGQVKQAFVDTICGEWPWNEKEICVEGFWEFIQTLTGLPYHHPLNIDVSEYLEPKPSDDMAFVHLLEPRASRMGGVPK